MLLLGRSGVRPPGRAEPPAGFAQLVGASHRGTPTCWARGAARLGAGRAQGPAPSVEQARARAHAGEMRGAGGSVCGPPGPECAGDRRPWAVGVREAGAAPGWQRFMSDVKRASRERAGRRWAPAAPCSEARVCSCKGGSGWAGAYARDAEQLREAPWGAVRRPWGRGSAAPTRPRNGAARTPVVTARAQASRGAQVACARRRATAPRGERKRARARSGYVLRRCTQV